MVNNMGKSTTDWERRFKQAYEEFNAEKEHICAYHEAKIAEMKQAHCKEIEAFAARCAEKEDVISGLKRRVRILEQENSHLNYIINDIQATNEMYAAQALAADEIPEYGYIEIEGCRTSAAYQDLVGILINNGYAVTVEPIQNGKKLGITIMESEEK